MADIPSSSSVEEEAKERDELHRKCKRRSNRFVKTIRRIRDFQRKHRKKRGPDTFATEVEQEDEEWLIYHPLEGDEEFDWILQEMDRKRGEHDRAQPLRYGVI